jgi:Spy/CpxP family protein refolding chaperone
MNRSICAALAAVVILAGTLTSARAESDKKSEDGPRPEWAAKMKKRMQERLELSDDQSAKLEAAFKSSREALKPLMEKARAANKKLKELVRGKGTDAEISAALKDCDAARKAVAEERRKLESSLSSFLKPRQIAKLRLQRERMMRRRMAMGRHGGRGGRWSHRRHHRRHDGDEDRGGKDGRGWRGNDD